MGKLEWGHSINMEQAHLIFCPLLMLHLSPFPRHPWVLFFQTFILGHIVSTALLCWQAFEWSFSLLPLPAALPCLPAGLYFFSCANRVDPSPCSPGSEACVSRARHSLEYRKLSPPLSLRILWIREPGSQLWVMGRQDPPLSSCFQAFSKEFTEQKRRWRWECTKTG